MKKTIIGFIIWYCIAYLIGYLFFGKEIFTLRFAVSTAIIMGIMHFLVFSPKNMKRFSKLVNPPKNKNE